MTFNYYSPLSFIYSLTNIPQQSAFRKLKYFILWMIIYAIIVQIMNDKLNITLATIELGQFHILFSFCLSIIISFRINIAYSRWWEARGHWGALVNNCRNLALKLNSYIGLNNLPNLQKYIAKFPLMLKLYLRNDLVKCKEIIKELKIECPIIIPHLPILLLQKINDEINRLRENNSLNCEQFLALNSHLSNLTDILGSCEKILNTPVPKSYTIFTRFALFFYMLIFPFGWIEKFQLFIIPILIVIIYVLLGLEVIAEEMEEPFGIDDNDLQLDHIAANVEKCIEQLSWEAHHKNHNRLD